MTLEEWETIYNAKTPEAFRRDNRFQLFYLPDKGFCEVGQTGNMLIINQLCGDARFWKSEIEKLARRLGNIAMCGTWCIRSGVKAYIRLFGYRVAREIKLVDGDRQFICKHKKTGKQGRVSPAFRYKDSGNQAYFITWEP